MIPHSERSGVDDVASGLQDLPPALRMAVAARAALRVLPLVFRQIDLNPDLWADTFQVEQRKRLILDTCRAAFTAWARNRYAGSAATEIAAAGAAAYYAAFNHSLVSIPPPGASRSAFAAAAAASFVWSDPSPEPTPSPGYRFTGAPAAFSFPDFTKATIDSAWYAAEAAADVSDDDLMDSIAADALWAAHDGAERLMEQPLWLPNTGGDSRPAIDFPLWARRPFDAFEQSPLVREGPWGIWTLWYRGLLSGSSADLFPASAILNVARWDAKFWEGSPDAVVAEVGRQLSSGDDPKPRPRSPHPIPRAEIVFLPDGPNPKVDFLDRARLAFVLAGRLNQIWDMMNGVGGPSGAAASGGASRWDDPLRPGFVVHIDSPWGGGKTSFADFVARILNPYRHDGAQPEWMKGLPFNDPQFKWKPRPWHIVYFNAWRHQHVRPPWWTFAEAIRRQCLAAIRHETNQRVGELPDPLPEYGYSGWLDRTAHAVRCSAVEWLWRIGTPDSLMRVAISAVSIISLFALVRFGLITFEDKGAALNGQEIRSSLFAGPVVLLLGGAPVLWAVVTAVTQTLLSGRPEAARNYSLGSGDPLARFRTHFARMIRLFKRPVLVIVDDLDRCEPGYIAELICGIQTILVSQRVVFVLLGDRDWIEQAFSETYKAMSGIYVGPEHEFGARFVEKAIQYSFVLPDVSKEARVDYVRKLLHVDLAASGMISRQVKPDLPFKQNMEAVLAKPDYADREAAAIDLRNSEAALKLAPEVRDEMLREFGINLSLRAAGDSSSEGATRDMIEVLAPALPSNPRQIKRIVNALALMQEVARLLDRAQIRSPEWQVLARWIVIMTEWPKSAYTLSRYPGLANRVLGLKTSGDVADSTLPPDSFVDELVQAIRSNKPVMDLLTFSDQDNGWDKRDIDSAQIDWLRILIPPASGRFLDSGKGPAKASA